MSHSSEIEKFNYTLEEWWDINGPLAALHSLNNIRLPYISKYIKKILHSKKQKSDVKNPILILDVGAGGGLLSIPLSQEYKNNVIIHALEPNKNSCQLLKKYSNLLQTNNIEVINKNLNSKSLKNPKYDIVICSEVLEHVTDYKKFILNLSDKVETKGFLIISTINQTITSFFESIIMAEYVLRMVPIKTHLWDNFIKPYEIYNILSKQNFKLINISGMRYNVLNKKWSLNSNIKNNYIICFVKE